MSFNSQTSPLENFVKQSLLPLISKDQPIEKAKEAKGQQKGAADAMLLAYLYLLDAAFASNHAADIKAKELNSNALAEQKVNNEIAELKWVYVPKSQMVQHKKTIGHTKWRFTPGLPTPNGGNAGHWVRHKKYATWWTTKNRAEVEMAQNKNEIQMQIRTAMEDKLAVLQQSASVGETNVSTNVQESMQYTQAGLNIINILQQLTYKALLRRQPS